MWTMFLKPASRFWCHVNVCMTLLFVSASMADAEPMYDLIPKDFYQLGESLHYDVMWSGIPLVKVQMQIKDLVTIEGHEAFHFVMTATSNPFVSMLYKVKDRIESYAHAEEMYSLRFEKRLREGDYKKDQVVIYDPEKGRAHYQEREKSEEVIVQKKAKDSLACFYLFRLMNMEIGDQMCFDVDSNKKLFRLSATAKELERIEIRNRGVFDTIRVDVDVAEIRDGEQKKVTEKGIILWLIDDDQHIPVRIRTTVFLGEVDMTLIVDKNEENDSLS